MKRFILALTLLAAVAVSGCVTQQDLDQQTKEIKQEVRDAERPLKKYTILDVDAELSCVNTTAVEHERHRRVQTDEEGYGAKTADVHPYYGFFEKSDRMQEFDYGKKIVVNGAENTERLDCHGEDARQVNGTLGDSWKPIGLKINHVKYNLSVYDQGTVVRSEVNHCRMYEDFGEWRVDAGGTYEDRWTEDVARDALETIYEDCFGIKKFWRKME